MAVQQWFRKIRVTGQGGDRARCRTLVVSLAACDQSKEADKAKQAGAAPPPPAVVVAEVVQKTVPIYSEYVAQIERQGNGGDSCPGAGVPCRAALRRGHDRQEGPAAVHARPARIRGEAAAGQGAARGRAGETRQGRNRRAAPEAPGRAASRSPAGLRQRRRQSGYRARGTFGRQGRSRRGRARLELLHDPLTDQRPYRASGSSIPAISSAKARPRCSTRYRVSTPFASRSRSARRNISGSGASRRRGE